MDHMGNKEMEDTVRVRLRGGASIVHTKPLFSRDAKWLYVASGESIKVFNVASGECLHTLHGHRGTITALKTNPKIYSQIYSASMDGTVRKWEPVEPGVLLQTYHVGGLLSSLHVTADCFYVTRINSEESNELISFPVAELHETPSDDPVTTQSILPSINHKSNTVSIGCKDSIIAAVNGNTLTVYNVKRKKYIQHVREGAVFTCVAVHPNNASVATGCRDGKILVWFDILQPDASWEVRHWHSQAVSDLSYTTDGSYMLSGGAECVLVKWQEHSNKKDSTLPRLGAPLLHITVSHDGVYYVTSHADNAIKVIKSSFQTAQHFQGLTRGSLNHQGLLSTDLMLDPRTKAVVFAGRPGHLQFYNIHADIQQFSLDIVGQNYVSSGHSAFPLVHTEVEKAAFDEEGKWLATVERRDDGKFAPEMKLKFWQYDTLKQEFVLNTLVDMPHEKSVHTIKFQPCNPNNDTDHTRQCITTSYDGEFKVWSLLDDSDIYKENKRWDCDWVEKCGSTAAGSADFSYDGSILAVAFENTLTTWNMKTKAQIKSLRMTANIRQVLFGQENYQSLLMVATENELMCWNVITYLAEYTEKMAISFMLAQPDSNNVAVFKQDNSLAVLTFKNPRQLPREPELLFHKADLSRYSVISAIFVPSKQPLSQESQLLGWQGESKLYFINSNQELLSFADKAQEDQEEQPMLRLTRELPPTAYSLLMAEKTRKEAARKPVTSHMEGHSDRWREMKAELLSMTVSVMPPGFSDRYMNAIMGEDGDSRPLMEEDDIEMDITDSGVETMGDGESVESDEDEVAPPSPKKQRRAEGKITKASGDELKVSIDFDIPSVLEEEW